MKKCAAKVHIYLISAIFLPKYFRGVAYYVEITGEGEEIIGEAVDVGGHFGGYLVGLRKGYYAALGTAAYGAGHLAAGGYLASSGQDEAVDARQGFVEGVDGCLEGLHAGRGDACGEPEVAVGRTGEVGADVEEMVLHGCQQLLFAVGAGGRCGYESYEGVELVDGPVGVDSDG